MALCATYHFQTVSVSLPQSTQWLSNLRTLRLVRCNLGDISFVVSLKSLEILDLKRSEFRLLPKGIEELTKLKLLDLRHCSMMENCDEVIKRCSQLEELYVYGDEAYFGKNISDSHNTWFLEKASFLKLQRYRLQFGKAKIPLKSLPLISRALLIRELKIPTLSIVVKDMMQRADCLFLEDLVGGCKSIIPDLVAAVGSMKQVIKLSLYSCLEIEFFIICSTNPSQACHDFLMLIAMKLSAMKHLKQVCLGPPPPKFFQNLKEVFMCDCPQLTRIFPGECNLCNLKELVISKCPMLTSLFSKQVAQTLLQLEVMKIEYCSELECIIFDEEDDIGATTREQKVHVLENSPLTFPKLRILTVEECDKLGYIFPIFFAQGLLELQKIKITSAPQMKYVFGQDVAEDLSTNQKKIQILFPQLKEIHLSFLPSLVKICQENCHPCWPSLKEINWLSCPNLTNKGPHEIETMGCEVLCISNCGVTDIFHVRGDGHRSNDQEATTSKLKEVKLEILQELSIIWRGLHSFTQILNLSYLESITIDRCGKLKCIFPAFIDRGFPHLIDLAIHSCENLEEIFEENEEELQNPSRVQECFPKLEEITVTGCPKLKVIFSIRMVKSFPQLKTLWISESLELKEIFGGPNEGIISDNEKEISVPNLRVITLENLPNLTDICQGFNFLPKELHKIQIYGCTKFAPILEATRFWREKGLRIFVCNRGVIDIFQIDGSVNFGGTEQYQYMGGQVVLLESEHKLWSGPIPRNVLSFQYLRSLVVSQCSTMKCLFPLSVIHEGLPELAYLLISGCDEMEQLVDIEEDIGEQEVNACINNIQVSGCFPKLRELVVDSCNKLIRLFPAKILIARELPQLEIMLIVNAAELRELFGQKVALPNMKKLTLASVPYLTSSSVETISRKGGGMYSIAQIGSRLVHLFE
ncbi:putative disease resistance protein At4g19050 [Prosopis cineraria]|uniref:putative disease resistance protein At4g19050 n=1 Tax=Prosopis cineraria TaxID=364024 RepID=UPI0024109B17|nr:putative disease resistance protein At4g19050 [Prosopis cineraria]